MDIEQLREYCLSLPLTEETLPFWDEDTLVYKVGGKMFAYTSISNFTWLGLKCDPEYAVELKELHAGIGTAPHMHPVHWICLDMQGSLPSPLIRELIDNSYRLVVAGITPKAKRLKTVEEINEAGFQL